MMICRIPLNSIQYWSWALIVIVNFTCSSTTKTICKDDHNNRTLANQMREDAVLFDVTLVTGNGEIRSHKMVLAGASPYFYQIFVKSNESLRNNLTIDGVNFQTLSSIIDYIYTSQVEITNENVQDIFVAANLLQLTALSNCSMQFLKDDVHLANCLEILAYADLHNFEDLLKHAEDFVVENFPEIVKSQDFLLLSYKAVSEIISRDDLNVDSEAKVFECILTWVKHDLESRRQYVVPLMKNVRIWSLPKEYILTTFLEEPLLKDDPQCKDFLIETLKVYLSKTDICVKTTRTNPRQNSNSSKILLVVSGNSGEKSVECYNFKEDSWSNLTDIPVTHNAAGATVLHGKVYVVGGWNENRVDIYDVATDKWTSPIGMQFKRNNPGVAILKNYIYAVGGYHVQYLNTVEKFDPEREQWTTVAPMLTARSAHGVGVIDDLLYAVGGYNFDSYHLSSVECYNPVTNTWTPVKNMHSIRSNVGVGVLNSLLYAVGGYDGRLYLKSAEVFDPKTGNWTMISDMNHPRYAAAVASANNLLYVTGGNDGSKTVASVEVYDPKTNKWTMLPSTMISPRYDHSAVVVDKRI